MTTTHVRVMLAGILVACCTLAVAVGVTDDDAPAAGTRTDAAAKGPYVALGDSYTSGPEIPDRTGTPAGCERSSRNYPALVAADLGLTGAGFRDVSCSGAKITDLTTTQSTADGTNPAQLTALSSDTRLVTVGIGGNDVGFSSMIKRCVGMGALYKLAGSGKYLSEDAPCARQYGGSGDSVEERIDEADDRLTRTLAEVRRRAPQARVYVVGYPALFPADSAECGREMSLAPGDVTFLRETELQLNGMLRQRAKASGIGYVDTYKPSEGHDACSAEGTRWIEPLVPKSPAAAVHPNERGERGMADAVLHTVRSAL
ncbi:SGNH/GDSL hydrolase family protein [Streptomyces sp. NBC_01352]|uniref:SGNH/GDSL hydrolase family protein n=1 Tax=Streptomyces sp. NBC_01352 TaxID=2903834 RepID=UPI002E2F0DEA|nr:SGNH/GDSL hydrolase family protein [Streptomyces sp. NBC_01352]